MTIINLRLMKLSLSKKFGTLLLLGFLSCGIWQCNAAGDSGESVATGVAEPENADITITVAGMGADKVLLVGMLNDQQFIVDQMESDANGMVHFKHDEPYKPGMYFVVLPSNANFQVLISEDQTFSLQTNINDLVGAMQVQESTDNELLYQNLRYEADYQRRLQPITSQLKNLDKSNPSFAQLEASRDALIEERRQTLDQLFQNHPQSFFVKFKKAGQNPAIHPELSSEDQVTYYRMEFWDDVDLSDPRLMATPVMYNKLKRYFEELTPQQPDSIILSLERLVAKIPNTKGSEYYKYFVNWVALAYEPTKTTLMDAEAVFVHMIQQHFTPERAFWSDSANTYALQLRAAEMANSLINQPGPNVKAPDINGQLRAVYDLKAPYIVVYLYNPDCEHCQEQSPVLVNLYQRWQAQSPSLVDVYAIAVDTEADLWRAYVAKTGMTWTNVFDPTNKAIYKNYFVNVTPEVYVLGPDRKIIAKNLNVDQLEEVIRRDQEKRK